MPGNIGKYQVLEEIGRGGFGVVYRAFDPTVRRTVAIKLLTVANDEELLSRFHNEAAAMGKLHHPNIVAVYDFGESEDGRPYMVMPYLQGETLHSIIRNGKPLSLLHKVGILSQVAEGLNHAHENGIVHRDVKPPNGRINLSQTRVLQGGGRIEGRNVPPFTDDDLRVTRPRDKVSLSVTSPQSVVITNTSGVPVYFVELALETNP